jgi:hypothetical protein
MPTPIPDQLRAHAWRHVTKHDGPITAGQLADAADLTRGAALRLLAEWTRTGRLARGAHPPGRYGPYHLTHHLPTPSEAPMPYPDPRTTDPRTTEPDSGKLRDAALIAAARGWHVFPLRPNDKRPAFPDHAADRCTGADPRCRDGHQGWEARATTDPDRIHRAWASVPYGVGVATGPSGLVVIDLDVPKPGQTPPGQWQLSDITDGADTLAVLCERAGQPVPLDTYTVTTGRGGTHLYFTAPDGVNLGNTAGKLGWLIDTRAHGGYVVAAGSTVNGRPYRTAYDVPATPLPAWLATKLTPPVPQRSAGQRVLDELLAMDARRTGYADTALRGEVKRVLDSPEHGHNNALNTAAYCLGRLVGAGFLPREVVEQHLDAAGAAIGQPERERTATIRSGLTAGIANPRSAA